MRLSAESTRVIHNDRTRGTVGRCSAGLVSLTIVCVMIPRFLQSSGDWTHRVLYASCIHIVLTGGSSAVTATHIRQ